MTEILKPLRHGNVLTEEEVLKELENYVPPKRDSRDDPEDCLISGLGTDYGLIFIDEEGTQIRTTLDGMEYQTVCEDTTEHETAHAITPNTFNCLYVDGDELYFTKRNALFKWPDLQIAKFGSLAEGITKKGDRFYVTLKEGSIVNHLLEGISFRLTNPCQLTVMGAGIYHTEGDRGRGLVKTCVKSLFNPKCWMSGLTSLDKKIYCGGGDMKIYSHSHSSTETLFETDFGIWSLKAIEHDGQQILFAGGECHPGILVVDIKKKEKMSTLLEGMLDGVSSIVTAPLELIERMN